MTMPSFKSPIEAAKMAAAISTRIRKLLNWENNKFQVERGGFSVRRLGPYRSRRSAASAWLKPRAWSESSSWSTSLTGKVCQIWRVSRSGKFSSCCNCSQACHTDSRTARTMGPKKSPMAPKAVSPPSTPNNTIRKGTRLAPLMTSGRITLSTVLTTRKPHSNSPSPDHSLSVRIREMPVGSQTSVAPIGISANNAVMAPNSTGAFTPATV